MVVGHQGIKQFQKLREKAISSIMTQEAKLPLEKRSRKFLTRGDCFHDGFQVLSAVTEWHKCLRDALRGTDTITGQILDLVDEQMLTDSKQRIEADSLCRKLQEIVNIGKAKKRIPIPMNMQLLLQEVEEAAPKPTDSQPTLSLPNSVNAPRLAPATIAGVRKSKFMGPALQKTALRSQILRSILVPERSSATLTVVTSRAGKPDGPSPATFAEEEVSRSPELPSHNRSRPDDEIIPQRDQHRHSISTSFVRRPGKPKRTTTIPHQTVFQAREESMTATGKIKKDPLLSRYFNRRDLVSANPNLHNYNLC